MTVNSQQRHFTAEIRRHGSVFPTDLPPEQVTRGEIVAGWHREILEAIADVRRQIAAIVPAQSLAVASTAGNAAALVPACVPGSVGEGGPVAGLATDDPRQAEMQALLQEVRALEQAIAQTRQEIAALRQLGKPPTSLSTATDELDAVVQATEGATECILNASERIDELVGRLRIQAADDQERALVEEIGEQVTHIFEACNFQDITGQRLNKVVGAMKFIEERVERMMQILGGSEAFAELQAATPPAPEHAAPDEAHLLCGPQLEEHKISQDDIDAFFA